ncbi:hypothetical protein ACQ4PT_037292 [Festuca glaucescens]
MANFAVDPTRFAPAGMQVFEPWGAHERPARMYVTASVTPPRRHESWAIAELIPRPVGDEVDQVLEQVTQHIVKDLQFEVISFAESAVGLGLFRMVDSVIRDLLVNTPQIPFGHGRTLSFVKHDEGSNFRATTYTSLGWLMMLNLPMDYRNEEFLREYVGKFGKMRGWFREDTSPSRAMVRCHYGGARDVPRLIVIREPQRYGGNVVSWTMPVYIMLTNQGQEQQVNVVPQVDVPVNELAIVPFVQQPILEEDEHNVQIFRVLMPDPVVLWDDFLKGKLPSLFFSKVDKPLDRFGELPLSPCEVSLLSADLSENDHHAVMPKNKKARKTKENVVTLVDTEARRSTRSCIKTRGYKLTPMLEKEPRKKPRSTKPRVKKPGVAPDTPIKPARSTPGPELHGSAGQCSSNASTAVEFVDDHLPQASAPRDNLLSVVPEVEVPVRAISGDEWVLPGSDADGRDVSQLHQTTQLLAQMNLAAEDVALSEEATPKTNGVTCLVNLEAQPSRDEPSPFDATADDPVTLQGFLNAVAVPVQVPLLSTPPTRKKCWIFLI